MKRSILRQRAFTLIELMVTIAIAAILMMIAAPNFTEFRRRVLEEAVRHRVNLVFAVVWDLDSSDDLDVMQEYIAIFDSDVAFVELRASLGTRLERNGTEHRLTEKKSKRDRDWSDDNVREMERFTMSSVEPTLSSPLLARHPHLVLDNTDLSPDQAADRILTWLEAAVR